MYMPTTLPNLLGRSDLIVVGTISTMTLGYFDFAIDEVVVGTAPNAVSLKVHKFQNWTCASRHTSYEVGQSAILFLYRSKAYDDTDWRVLGAANEGEWELYQNEFYDRTSHEQFRGFFHRWKFRYLVHKARQGGDREKVRRYFIDRYPRSDVIDAIKWGHKCFHFERDLTSRFEEVKSPKVVCPQPEIRKFRKLSPFHRRVVDEILEFKSIYD